MATPVTQAQTTEDQVTAAVLLVLLSGLSLADTAAHIAPLLAQLGISSQATEHAVALIAPQIDPVSRTPHLPAAPKLIPHPDTGLLEVIPGEARTPAQTFIRTTEVARHSRYLVASARRFQADPTPEMAQTERRYLAQHLAAIRATRAAAARVDEQVARHGQTLGWWARLDERTTPECRAAHGSNFSAARPPRVGYPGTLHGGTCRCRAGSPFHEGLPTDEAIQTNLPRITGAHDVAFTRDEAGELAIDLSRPGRLRRLRSVLSRPHPGR